MENSGDWNCEYHYYFDGWSRIEERDSSGQILKQYAWGTQYIDELVQAALNDDPADENEDVCETKYWGLQDANFNLLAVVGSDGSFAERYEYTPYGQRTIFKEASAGDDPMLTAPILESQRWQVSSVDQPYGICDIGHQGLFFDKEWKWYDNRTRPYSPVLARFPVRDGGYRDGMNLYRCLKNSPIGNRDPLGQETIVANAKIMDWNWFGVGTQVHYRVEISVRCEGNTPVWEMKRGPETIVYRFDPPADPGTVDSQDNADCGEGMPPGIFLIWEGSATEGDMAGWEWGAGVGGIAGGVGGGIIGGIGGSAAGGAGALPGIYGGAAAGGVVGGIVGGAAGGLVEVIFDQEVTWTFRWNFKACCCQTSNPPLKVTTVLPHDQVGQAFDSNVNDYHTKYEYFLAP